MDFQQRQSHLIEQIAQLKDEYVLGMLEEELSYHLHDRDAIQLCKNNLYELITIADEPEDKDVVSENEYRTATEKWRMKY